MPLLYIWRADPTIKIYGPFAGESGPWRCTCEHGERHLQPYDPRTESKPALCRHLSELFAVAEMDNALTGRVTETLRGEAKTDVGCTCNGGKPLKRLPPPQAPPQAPPGEISRSAPCPCGSGDKYKRCHGMDPINGGPNAPRSEHGDIGLPIRSPGAKPPSQAARPKKTPKEKRITATERREAERREAKRRKARITTKRLEEIRAEEEERLRLRRERDAKRRAKK